MAIPDQDARPRPSSGVPAEHRLWLDQQHGSAEPWQSGQGAEHETIGLSPAETFTCVRGRGPGAAAATARPDRRPVAEGCEGEADEESVPGANDGGAWTASDHSWSERIAGEFGWTFGTPQPPPSAVCVVGAACHRLSWTESMQWTGRQA